MYRLTLHLLKATKPNFDDVSASLELTKESGVFSFFIISFPCLYTWGKRQALNFPVFFRRALHHMSFCPPLPPSPFNSLYLMQLYLLSLAKLCIISYSESPVTAVSKLKLSFCLPFCCYLRIFVFSAVYPDNLFFLFTQSAKVPFSTSMSASSAWAQPSASPISIPTYKV